MIRVCQGETSHLGLNWILTKRKTSSMIYSTLTSWMPHTADVNGVAKMAKAARPATTCGDKVGLKAVSPSSCYCRQSCTGCIRLALVLLATPCHPVTVDQIVPFTLLFILLTLSDMALDGLHGVISQLRSTIFWQMIQVTLPHVKGLTNTPLKIRSIYHGVFVSTRTKGCMLTFKGSQIMTTHLHNSQNF